MKSRALAALAALSILSVPAAVQAGKPAEVTLHIEATAQVPPDRVVVPFTITGRGEDEAEARADLRAKEGKLLTALAAKGIDAARVTTEGADSGQDPVKLLPVEEAAVCAAAAAAEDAAAPVRNKARAHAATIPSCAATYVVVSKALLITLDDPAKIDLLQPLSGEDGFPNGRLRPVFSQSDPAAARKKARKEALAKADAESEAYAAAMGYRVVRIVRVSNAKPSINMSDMFGFIATMDDRSGRMQPSWFSATVTESVAVDYVMTEM